MTKNLKIIIDHYTAVPYSGLVMKNIHLHTELTDWNNGDLSKTAPSQLDDPNNILADARTYELGTYECSNETAKARSQSAIDAYCETEEARQY
jgi:hypothetical protein